MEKVVTISKGLAPERVMAELPTHGTVSGVLTAPKNLGEKTARATGYIWNAQGQPVISGPLAKSKTLAGVYLATPPEDMAGLMCEGKWPAFLAFNGSFVCQGDGPHLQLARAVIARFAGQGYTGDLSFR